MNGAKKLTGRARIAVASLFGVVITDAAAVVADWYYGRYLFSLHPEALLEELELVAPETAVALVTIAQVVAIVLAAVFFLRWFKLVFQPLSDLGLTSYSPRWIVWGFFIPILNLFRPEQLMREVWDATSLQWEQQPSRFARLERPRDLVDLWWLLFVATTVFGSFVGRMETATAREYLSATPFILLANWLDIVAALVAIALVRNVTSFRRAVLDDVTAAVSGTRSRNEASIKDPR